MNQFCLSLIIFGSAERSKVVPMLQFFFVCMSVIATVPLCSIIFCFSYAFSPCSVLFVISGITQMIIKLQSDKVKDLVAI